MEFNLENIKKEIEARKSESIIKEQATGRGGVPKMDKRKFLVDLLTSVNNGTPTPAVQALRAVSESTEQKYGAVGKAGGQYTPPVNYPQPVNEMYQQPVAPTQQYDRGDAFFEQQMQKAADMLKYKSNPSGNVPQQGAGLSQTLAEYANAPFVGTGMQQPLNEGGGFNANNLNEHITRTMNEVMGGSNFTKIVAEAYKNMINEMYTKEKVETVLVEIVQSDVFKKIMKKQIVDTLIEIQNRKKEPIK